jgi:hypothetical protein
MERGPQLRHSEVAVGVCLQIHLVAPRLRHPNGLVGACLAIHLVVPVVPDLNLEVQERDFSGAIHRIQQLPKAHPMIPRQQEVPRFSGLGHNQGTPNRPPRPVSATKSHSCHRKSTINKKFLPGIAFYETQHSKTLRTTIPTSEDFVPFKEQDGGWQNTYSSYQTLFVHPQFRDISPEELRHWTLLGTKDTKCNIADVVENKIEGIRAAKNSRQISALTWAR